MKRAILGLTAQALLLAGCSPAETRTTPECHLGDFLGDWVSARRGDEGVSIGAKAVTVVAGRARTRVSYVANRDFGPVTRQVLRQEFGNLTGLGVLPVKQTQLGEMRCAIHLIRPHGAAALVQEPGRGLILLEETDGADPPATMRLRRGRPRPDLQPGAMPEMLPAPT
ncbi:hypothetical protein [Novosphingobium resinovorum]|uniref:hypothetical protein n=1 Tax=Novosphingobium resinovorum TaxID=158500 RepID=UPI002ED3C8D4|nr:hypothetical protein [Novosphingobium resinovorum]